MLAEVAGPPSRAPADWRRVRWLVHHGSGGPCPSFVHVAERARGGRARRHAGGGAADRHIDRRGSRCARRRAPRCHRDGTSDALMAAAARSVTGEAGSYQFDAAARHLHGGLRAHRLRAAAGAKASSCRWRGRRRVDVELGVGTLQETVTVSGESPVVDVSSHGDADQHQQGPLRGDSHRPQPVDDGRARARRRHRPSRRRRHRGRAAIQHRGVRVGQQPEVVQHRRPEGELGRRRRRRHDDVLRLRDVRRIQHADGVGHRGERRVRRLHEHGHQVGRQPLRVATTTSTS